MSWRPGEGLAEMGGWQGTAAPCPWPGPFYRAVMVVWHLPNRDMIESCQTHCTSVAKWRAMVLRAVGVSCPFPQCFPLHSCRGQVPNHHLQPWKNQRALSNCAIPST